MRDYIIMTDSCCDLNQQEVDELGLTVLPLSFTIDGKTYLMIEVTDSVEVNGLSVRPVSHNRKKENDSALD